MQGPTPKVRVVMVYVLQFFQLGFIKLARPPQSNLTLWKYNAISPTVIAKTCLNDEP